LLISESTLGLTTALLSLDLLLCRTHHRLSYLPSCVDRCCSRFPLALTVCVAVSRTSIRPSYNQINISAVRVMNKTPRQRVLEPVVPCCYCYHDSVSPDVAVAISRTNCCAGTPVERLCVAEWLTLWFMVWGKLAVVDQVTVYHLDKGVRGGKSHKRRWFSNGGGERASPGFWMTSTSTHDGVASETAKC